jgi:ubiquinone/menaquinone biosynthesis C-methylase UbiE
MSDINTAEYWDKVWLTEGANTWRLYPKCFMTIATMIGKGKNVLELGGGVGILAQEIAKKGNHVYIIDISESAIEIAWKTRGIPGLAARMPPIPTEKKYDYIVATEFLEHLEDPLQLITEAKDLAPRAIYAVPNGELSPDETKEHHHIWNEEEFRTFLSQVYTDVKIETFEDAFYFNRFSPGEYQPIIRIKTILAECVA